MGSLLLRGVEEFLKRVYTVLRVSESRDINDYRNA